MAKPLGISNFFLRSLSFLLIMAIFIELSPVPVMGQSTSMSLLSRILANRASRLKVSFTYSPTFPVEGQAVKFEGTSTGNPTSWLWDFGDGSTSAEQNPVHIFEKSGFRKVTLDTTNSLGSKRTLRTITVMPAPATATFVFSPASPTVGQTVMFADTSSGDPTSWRWDFGDGATSTAKNPTHAFTQVASYTVTLISSNSSSSKRGSQTVTVTSASTLTASFTYSPASPTADQPVQFTDTSAGNPTAWLWNFGDGSTSTTRNPSHVFATAGSYLVSLAATNNTESRTASRTVTVVAGLASSFTYSPASPVVGQSVQFADTSTGSPTSWQWDFNDGTTSTTRNPSHTFAAAGSYAVTLVVSNSSGSSTATRIINVVPASTLIASFTFSPTSPVAGQAVQFTDTSTGSPSAWQWNFGDGSTSTGRNPSHIFSAAGSYNVILTIANSTGSNSYNQVLSASPASNDVHYAASPALADVQAVINAADPGDTVVVPAGSVTWTSTLSWSKAIHLRAAGIGNTVITHTGTAMTPNIAANLPWRISGFDFIGANQTAIIARGGSKNVVISGCRFRNTTTSRTNAVRIGDVADIGLYMHGVVADCIFLDTYVFVSCGMGETSWQAPTNLGGGDAIYFEDCSFSYPNGAETNVIDCNNGARYVMRHNIIEDAYCEAHTLQNGWADYFVRGTRLVEIYENDFRCVRDGWNHWTAMFIRAGTGVIFINTSTHVGGWPRQQMVVLDNVRSMRAVDGGLLGRANGGNIIDENSPVDNGTGEHMGSNNSATLVCSGKGWSTDAFISVPHYVYNLTDGSMGLITRNTSDTVTAMLSGGTDNNWDAGDQFKITNGYAALDQIGRGPDAAVGDDPVIPRYTAHRVPQADEPMYIWNNILDGMVREPNNNCEIHIQKNRDYYTTPKPGYTPYTYPHPLRKD